jgi:hypothetical protein
MNALLRFVSLSGLLVSVSTFAVELAVPIVFVSRQIPPDGTVYWDWPKSLPGVGPYSRFQVCAPGQLVVRETNGADRPLVDPLTGRTVFSRWWRNFRMATDATCVGCHAGHTMIPVPPTAEDALWSNFAPGADGAYFVVGGSSPEVNSRTSWVWPQLMGAGRRFSAQPKERRLAELAGCLRRRAHRH